MEPERRRPALLSELLEEIFLRVASPADLARASAACVSFRRLIADPSFLRRYRSIHPPLLLGLVNSSGFHPSAAVARAVALSLDFLPHTSKWDSWEPRDVRDGRFLVERPTREKGLLWDLAVCDPLSQRYLMLPRITNDLLASIGINKGYFHWGGLFYPFWRRRGGYIIPCDQLDTIHVKAGDIYLFFGLRLLECQHVYQLGRSRPGPN